MENWAIGMLFFYSSFFEDNGKNGANKCNLFHFSVFLFFAKKEKREKIVRNRRLFHFSLFLTIAQHKK